MSGAVFVYPADPTELAETARGALEAIESVMHREAPFSWVDPGIPGAFMASPVLERIDECDSLAADLTYPTFNISYQIGYAIGRGKPLLITKNAAVRGDDQLAREVGLFGSLANREYQTGRQLAEILTNAVDAIKVVIPSTEVNQKAPVYALLPRTKTDLEIHLISRVKKARLFFRTFDPQGNRILFP
jgi:hypothetical protein